MTEKKVKIKNMPAELINNSLVIIVIVLTGITTFGALIWGKDEKLDLLIIINKKIDQQNIDRKGLLSEIMEIKDLINNK
jgi:hypothetical protein